MRLRLSILALISLATVCRNSSAQEATNDSRNAATLYRAAKEEAQRVGFETLEIYEPVWAFEQDPDRGPSSEARSILRRNRAAIAMARRAAQRDACDFGPDDPFDQERGKDFSAIRTSANLLRQDYMVRIVDGGVDEAIDECCDVFRMAEHAAGQPTMMHALVGASVLYVGDRLVQFGIDRAVIGPNQATRLLRAMNRLINDDPLRFRAAMTEGQAAYFDNLIGHYAGEEGLRLFREDYRPHLRKSLDEKSIAKIEAMTPDELSRLLTDIRDRHRRASAILAEHAPDKAIALLKSIDEEAVADENWPVTRLLAGRSAQTLDVMLRMRKTLDDRIVMLKGIADGSIDPLTLANAACWYIRASVAAERIDPDAQALIDAFAATADEDAAVSVELAAALDRADVRETLALIDFASKIERCDFDYATGNWTHDYGPYHAGLLTCGRLMLADAARLARDGEIDAALRRVVQMQRLSAGLASDRFIAGGLAAHRLFNDAQTALARAAVVPLTAERVAPLRESLDRFSRADPFHYQPKLQVVRTYVTGWLLWLVQGAPEQVSAATQEDTDAADAILAQCDADRLLSILVACDQRYMTHGPVAQPLRPPADGLWPVYDLNALQRSRDMLPVIEHWGRSRVIAGIAQADLPRIAPIEQRVREAESAYRNALRRITAVELPLSRPSQGSQTRPSRSDAGE